MDSCCICKSSNFGPSFVVTREDRYLALLAPEKRTPPVYLPCLACGAIIYQGDCSFDEHYLDGGYYGVEGDAAAFLMRRFEQIIQFPAEKSDNKRRIKRIRDYLSECGTVSRPRRVLDIGAGMGVFLFEFLNHLWHGAAIEPDPHAVAHLRKVLSNVEIYQGFSTAVETSGKFDLITFNRVLEHVADPLPVLLHETGRLESGGILYVEVPDVLSLSLDGPNNEAFGIGHYVVYSPLALALLASKANLRLLHLHRVREPSGKFTLYAFLSRESSTEGALPGTGIM